MFREQGRPAPQAPQTVESEFRKDWERIEELPEEIERELGAGTAGTSGADREARSRLHMQREGRALRASTIREVPLRVTAHDPKHGEKDWYLGPEGYYPLLHSWHAPFFARYFRLQDTPDFEVLEDVDLVVRNLRLVEAKRRLGTSRPSPGRPITAKQGAKDKKRSAPTPGPSVPRKPESRRADGLPTVPPARSAPRTPPSAPSGGPAFGGEPSVDARRTSRTTARLEGRRLRANDVVATPRTRELASIIGTLMPDQFVAVEAPAHGLTIITGGPGTGKTAVAVHRAMLLVGRHRERTPGVDEPASAARACVISPDQAHARYVAAATEDGAITFNALTDLVETTTAVGGRDRAPVRRVKGDERMLPVLHRLLTQWPRPVDDPDVQRELRRLRSTGVTIADDAVSLAVTFSLQRPVTGRPRRTAFVNALKSKMTVRRKTSRRGATDERPWESLAAAVWPERSATQLWRAAQRDPALLARAAGDDLSAEEQDLLIRTFRADRQLTEDDLPLIDELQDLLRPGSRGSLGHVIVDEAQMLTPMWLRALARRAGSGLTLVGDPLQRGGPGSLRSWDHAVEVLRRVGSHLKPAEARNLRLETSYRVPREILEVATAALPPTSRSGAPAAGRSGGTVTWTLSATDDLIDDAVDAALALAADDSVGTVAVVAVVRHAAQVRTTLAGCEPDDVRRISVHDPDLVTGHEFDAVVVIEPAAIVDAAAGASRDSTPALYVALSRATKALNVVHARLLPERLRGFGDASRVEDDAACRLPAARDGDAQ